jgi:predicted AlkP superfamily pyrophosphatase or phosphodiesterase
MIRFLKICSPLLGVVLLSVSAVAAPNRYVLLITMDGFAAYNLEDPAAPIPTLRQLASEGASAKGMKVANPSVTWPNHTTLVTGVYPEKHSVFYNGVLVRSNTGVVAIDPKRDKADLVAVPTVYDLLHKKGYRTAGINWPCTRNSSTLDLDFPDVPDTITHTTPKFRDELVAAGILTDATDRGFMTNSAPRRDQQWTAAAGYALRKHKPHFTLFHMLITDGIQHKYGPQSPAAYAALALVDSQLREVLTALDEAGIRKQTTVLVVADHGFDTATNTIHPNVILRKNGFLETGPGNRIIKARAQAVPEGGSAIVYLTNAESKNDDRVKVLEVFRSAEGIAEVIEPDRFPELGLPKPDKNPQMGDFILTPKPGYAFSGIATGDAAVTPVTLTVGGLGNHGYLSTNPKMNAVFVAAGRGIKRGVKLDVIDNRDVAPTVAHLLGEKFPADGKVLTEILE